MRVLKHILLILSLFTCGLCHSEELFAEQPLINEIQTLTLLTQPFNEAKEFLRLGKLQIDKRLFLPDPELLEEDLEPYFKEPPTLARLNEVVSLIKAHYSMQGYPFVSINLMPGEITEGEIKISIVPARVGKVQAVGAKHFSNRFIARQLRIHNGELLNAERHAEALQWINQNPFFSSTVIYEKGESPGETDVLVQTEDRRPYRAYLGYDNTGYWYSGASRYYTGFNFGNLFNIGHQLNLQVMSANKPREWLGGGGSFFFPFPGA